MIHTEAQQTVDTLTLRTRLSLLSTVPDGEVARWLLNDPIDYLSDNTPLDRLDSTPALWLSPTNLSNDTIQYALNRQPTHEAASVLDLLLQTANSRTGARRTKAVYKRLRAPAAELPPLSTYDGIRALSPLGEEWHEERPQPVSELRGLIGNTWATEVYVQDMADRKPWSYVTDEKPHTTYSPRGTNEALSYYHGANRFLGRTLWRNLGDDPAAWSLALELLLGPDSEAILGETIETVSSTQDNPTLHRAPRRGLGWWTRTPKIHTYEDQPITGPAHIRSTYSIRW